MRPSSCAPKSHTLRSNSGNFSTLPDGQSDLGANLDLFKIGLITKF